MLNVLWYVVAANMYSYAITGLNAANISKTIYNNTAFEKNFI